MDDTPVDAVSDQIDSLLDAGRITEADAVLRSLPAGEVVQVLARHDTANRAKLYRLLPRELALEVFDRLDVETGTELFNGLRNEEVVAFFEEMDPDDRARLVDELPAGVARTLMRGLSPAERALTTPMLGYPSKSIGRYMSTEYVRVLPTTRVSEALAKVEAMADAAETIYLLPVTDPSRLLLGVVSLRRLIASDPDAVVGDVMSTPVFVHGASDAEEASSPCRWWTPSNASSAFSPPMMRMRFSIAPTTRTRPARGAPSRCLARTWPPRCARSCVPASCGCSCLRCRPR